MSISEEEQYKLRESIKRLAAIGNELREQLDCETGKQNALRKQCDELREELDCRTGERNALREECTILRRENDDLKARLRIIDNDHTEMEQGIDKLEKEIEKL